MTVRMFSVHGQVCNCHLCVRAHLHDVLAEALVERSRHIDAPAEIQQLLVMAEESDGWAHAIVEEHSLRPWVAS